MIKDHAWTAAAKDMSTCNIICMVTTLNICLGSMFLWYHDCIRN